MTRPELINEMRTEILAQTNPITWSSNDGTTGFLPSRISYTESLMLQGIVELLDPADASGKEIQDGAV